MRLPPFLLGCTVAVQSVLALAAAPASAQESATSVAPRAAANADALLVRARALLLEAQEAERLADLPTARAKSVEAVDALLAGGTEAETPEALDLLTALGKVAGDAADLDAELRACERVLTVRTRTLPEDALELQSAKLDMAGALLDRRAAKEARPHIERALAVLERTVPEEHPERLRGGNMLGLALRAAGDHAGARAVHQRVLEIRTRTLPEGHEDILKSQENFAIGLAMLDEYAEARVLFEKVHDTYARTLPDEHPKLLRARQNMTAILSRLGELEASRSYSEKVYEVRARTLPEDHPQLQDARRSLAEGRKELGDLEGARALQEQVVASFSRTLPSDHPDLTTARRNLARTCMDLGQLERARQILEQLLEVMVRSDSDPVALAWTQLELGGVLRRSGDLDLAKSVGREALLALERLLPNGHIDLAKARMNHAITLTDFDDHNGARTLEERGLAALAKALGDDHPDVNFARSQLARTLYLLGDRLGARALHERALSGYALKPPSKLSLEIARINYALVLPLDDATPILESVLGELAGLLPEDHATVLAAQMSLAWRKEQNGDLHGAQEIRQHVFDLERARLPEYHPSQIDLRHGLARSLRRLGECARARTLLEQALELGQRFAAPKDRQLQRVRLELAMVLAVEAALAGASVEKPDAERGAQCSELLRAACEAELGLVREAQLASPGREVEEIAANLPVVVSDVLSFARGYGVLAPQPGLAETAFVLSETSRGAAVTAAAFARSAVGVERHAELRAAWKAASAELARLGQGGASREAFESARARREQAERELLTLARELAGPSAVLDASPAKLRAALDARSALVVFRSYSDWTVKAVPGEDAASQPRPSSTWIQRLAAFVVRGGATPGPESEPAAVPVALVDLGPRKDVRLAIEAWRRAALGDRERGLAAAASAPDLRALGEAVRRLVLDPLEPHLAGVERLVVVLDDVLHLVPLDALPLAGTEGLVGDVRRVEVRVTSTELLAPSAPSREGALIALGGASFNQPPLELSAEEAEQVAKDRPVQVASVLRGTAWERGFEPLTHTRDEARGVAALYGEAFEDGRSLVLTQRKASRDALVESAPGARFLHVATHGWFAPESIRSWADEPREGEQADETSSLDAAETVRRMSPMLLAGLALSGANLPEDGTGRAPGLVTAEELAALDLSGCELAVLSACDTNVGERRVGQGVASFQRALHMAGARRVVTSLWKVPDEATKELMLDFYRRLWVQKTPAHAALWAAKKRLREARDEDGRPKYGARDWAGWVLTGQPD